MASISNAGTVNIKDLKSDQAFGSAKKESLLSSTSWLLVSILFAVFVFLGVQVLTYPMMDGWFYFPLGDASSYPYRDYFFPVTPLVFWEAQLFRHFESPLLASRLTMLFVTPPILAWSTYALCRSLVRPFSAFVLSALSSSALAMLGLETLSGWNSQFLIYLAGGAACFYVAWYSGTETVQFSLREYKFSNLFFGALAGVFFALAVLAKQTAAVTVLVALLLIVFWIAGRTKSIRTSFFLAAIPTTTAFTMVMAVLLVELKRNHALAAFISDMSSGGGKNLNFLIQLTKTGDYVVSLFTDPLTVAAAALLAWVVIRWFTLEFTSLNVRLTGSRWLLIGLFTFFSYVLFSQGTNQYPWLLFVLPAVQIISSVLLFSYYESRAPYVRGVYLAVAFLMVPFCVGWVLSGSNLVDYFSSLVFLSHFWTTASVLLLVGITWFVFGRDLGKADSNPERTNPTQDDVGLHKGQLALVICVGISWGSLVNVLSSGAGIYLQWFVPAISVFTAFLLHQMRFRWNALAPIPLITSFIMLSVLTFTSHMVVAPYSWWGWKEPGLLQGPRTRMAMNYLTGVWLSEESAAFYEKVRTLELEAATLSEKADPTLYTFLNGPAFGTISGIRNYPVLPCPVIWYDICPNYIVQASLETFQNEPADIVVWPHVDDASLTAHESLFLGEPSAVRAWNDYRIGEVAAGRWKEVGTIDPTEDSPNRVGVTVFYRTP